MPDTNVGLEALLVIAVTWMAVPLLPRPVTSVKLLSNGRCRTNAEMLGELVGGGRTVKVAGRLLVVPLILLTLTMYVPASLIANGRSVSGFCVAPGMSTPFFCHW